MISVALCTYLCLIMYLSLFRITIHILTSMRVQSNY